jgi:hypothetical protein
VVAVESRVGCSSEAFAASVVAGEDPPRSRSRTLQHVSQSPLQGDAGRRATREYRPVDGDRDEGLGAKFWLLLIGGAIACAIAAVLVLFFFTAAWARWGFFGAFLLLSAILLLVGWIVDRRDKRARGSFNGS